MTKAKADNSLEFPQSVNDEIKQYLQQLTQAHATLKAGKSNARSRQILKDIDDMVARLNTTDFADSLSTAELIDVSDQTQSLLELASVHGQNR